MVETEYDIKNHRIEQSGLVDHLHKGLYQNQCFEQKLKYLRFTLIDQVVGEIITDGIFVNFVSLRKNGFIGYRL